MEGLPSEVCGCSGFSVWPDEQRRGRALCCLAFRIRGVSARGEGMEAEMRFE